MEYQSPGLAFSSGLEDFLVKKEQQKRQDMLDHLAVQKAAREVDNETNQAEEHRQDLAERKREFDESNRWKNEAEKVTAKKVADKEAADAAQAAGRAAFVAGLPEGPQKTAYQGEQFGLHNVVPPKEAAGAGAEPIARQNPRSGVVERLVDGQWQSVTGDVPKGTHFMTEPAPKDTTARDAAAAAKEATRRDNVYKTAVAELDKAAAPIAAHIQGINDLGTMLNARTPEADTLIAPLVLKSTISGTGTGFRMTRAEIENVVGGRSKWESLNAALNKWSQDPKQALSITDEQRTELRNLAKEIRKSATTQMGKITKARHAMDDTDDPKEIQKIATKLQEDLSVSDEAAAAETAAPKMTAAEYVKKALGK